MRLKIGKYRNMVIIEDYLLNNKKRNIVTPIFDLKRRFYGIALNELRFLVYYFPENSDIPHPFNKEKETADKD